MYQIWYDSSFGTLVRISKRNFSNRNFSQTFFMNCEVLSPLGTFYQQGVSTPSSVQVLIQVDRFNLFQKVTFENIGFQWKLDCKIRKIENQYTLKKQFWETPKFFALWCVASSLPSCLLPASKTLDLFCHIGFHKTDYTIDCD